MSIYLNKQTLLVDVAADVVFVVVVIFLLNSGSCCMCICCITNSKHAQKVES